MSTFSAEIFELILMDTEMPDTDGLEATRALRIHKPKDSHTAIYAVTANASSADPDRGFAAGMDGFMPKPIEIDAALKVVAQVASTPRNEPALAS